MIDTEKLDRLITVAIRINEIKKKEATLSILKVLENSIDTNAIGAFQQTYQYELNKAEKMDLNRNEKEEFTTLRVEFRALWNELKEELSPSYPVELKKAKLKKTNTSKKPYSSEHKVFDPIKRPGPIDKQAYKGIKY